MCQAPAEATESRGGFKSALQEEKAAERRAIATRILQQKIEAMQETLPWGSLQRVQVPADCSANVGKRGEDSKEVQTQLTREKSALEAFFTAQTIPDTPAEPAVAADGKQGPAEEGDDAAVPVIPVDDDGASAQAASNPPQAAAAPAQSWQPAAGGGGTPQTAQVSPQDALVHRPGTDGRVRQLSSLVSQISNLHGMANQMPAQQTGTAPMHMCVASHVHSFAVPKRPQTRRCLGRAPHGGNYSHHGQGGAAVGNPMMHGGGFQHAGNGWGNSVPNNGQMGGQNMGGGGWGGGGGGGQMQQHQQQQQMQQRQQAHHHQQQQQMQQQQMQQQQQQQQMQRQMHQQQQPWGGGYRQ